MWCIPKCKGRSRNSRFTAFLLVVGISLNIYFMVYSNLHATSITGTGQQATDFTARMDFKRIAPLSHQETCAIMPRWVDSIITPKTPTDWTKWGFRNTIPCPGFSVDYIPTERQKVLLNCKTPGLITSWTNSTSDIEHVQFGDKCLEKVIDSCCTDNKHVPNVVHYVWYSDKKLEFFNFVSFISVLRFMKPCLILLHGDSVPHGKYWDYFVSISPNIIHVNRTRPTHMFGHKLAFKEHSSDVMRIEALKAYGGVYLDFDEILLRPLEPLRKYEYTQGHELKHTMGSQLILSKKNATFLHHWYESYRNDYKTTWAYNALWVPVNIAKKHPNLIHIEGFNFTRPNWQNMQKIFKGNYDWRTNYGMHLYVRYYKNETTTQTIRTLNSTIGAVCRHILFGNKEICIN